MINLLKAIWDAILLIGTFCNGVLKLFISVPDLRFLLILSAIVFFVTIVKKIAKKVKSA